MKREECHDYDDIIALPHHVSDVHPTMPRRDRAAQFSSFAALTGYEAVVAETAREFGEKETGEYETEAEQGLVFRSLLRYNKRISPGGNEMEKIALITGASRGIGRATARRLAHEGYTVAVNYHVRQDCADSLVAELAAEGLRAAAFQADVADRAQVEDMVRRVEDTFGPVSLLVNNAGVAGQALFQDVTEEMWRRYFGVNIDGAFHTIQAVLPPMLHEHAGCIVNVSSMWGLRGTSCEVTYSATKAALIALTRSLAAELAPTHIRVNCVAPGVIKTDMLDALPSEVLPQLAEETPLRRLGRPEDIAAAVSYLASDDASFVTGQVLTVDGGFIL